MAKRGRHRPGGRVTPKGTRPHGYRPRHAEDWAEPEPDLMGDVRRALADDHPLGLLALVSSLLAVVDPRGANPFDRDRSQNGPSRDELLRTFLAVDSPETSALLAGIAALSTDDVERRRIGRVLDGRDHPLPPWLSGMSRAQAYASMEMTHVLRDGDNVMVGVRLPTGDQLTAVVYIDHNMGTLVKDAFVLPESLDELVVFMRAKNDDPDTAWGDVPLADARARIADAIETGAITFPPFETDSWPVCRPLIEWMVGLLPEGGKGYERPEWSDDDRRALTRRFFASPFAAGLAGRDRRDMLGTILWFACDYGPGDPMRWSPSAVEILLDDWIPRKVLADVAYLANAPEVLRAFVRFCHAERAIPAHLTAETIDAIDRWEPDYQTTIHSPRPQGPAALLAAVGALDPEGPWRMPGEEETYDYETTMHDILQRAVGGDEALDALDDVALPDEPFDWDGITDDVHDRVAEVLEFCDRGCEILDTEYRTAARRVLARIARQGPDALQRGRSDTAAAAICWLVGRVNDLFSQSRGGLTQKDFFAHFGVGQASIPQRAGTLLDAGGFARHPNDLTLGSADYLVSRRRRRLIDSRDRYNN